MAFEARVVADVVILPFVMLRLVRDRRGTWLSNRERDRAGTDVAGERRRQIRGSRESCGSSKEHSVHDGFLSAVGASRQSAGPTKTAIRSPLFLRTVDEMLRGESAWLLRGTVRRSDPAVATEISDCRAINCR